MSWTFDQELDVKDALSDAKGIAWDTCHKIYILMDDAQMKEMNGYGYDPLISSDEMSSTEMFDTVVKWYDESCGLKFISVVETMPNGEPDFNDIVDQFANDEEEEEDE